MQSSCRVTKAPSFATVPQQELHGLLFQKVFLVLKEKFACRLFCKKSCRSTSHLCDDIIIPENDDNHLVLWTIRHINKLHKRLSNKGVQKCSGLDQYGILGDILATVLSTPVVTYFFAPVFTLMEFEVLFQLRKLIGYENPDQGDGMFVPGMGFGTNNALRMAIHKKYPDVKTLGILDGTRGEVPCIFVSECFYNVARKASIINGMDVTNSCLLIPSCKNTGGMDLNKLEEAIEDAKKRRLTPLMVIASLGSQNYSRFDNISGIANIALRHNLWLHVDGSFGGPFVFSERLKTIWLKGIEYSDSFLLGMETLLGAPHCTTLLVTPHSKICQDAFGLNDPVVFEKSQLYHSKYDRGDATIQTCRRPDSLKAWLMWKVRGTSGLGDRIEEMEHIINSNLKEQENSEHRKIKNRKGGAHGKNEKPGCDCKLFETIFSVIESEALFFQEKRHLPPVTFRTPEELKNNFDFSLKNEGLRNEMDVIEIVKEIVAYSNKVSHPHYAFQLTCSGLDPFAIIGDIVSAFTSCGMESREESLVYGQMEEQVFAEVRKLVAYPPATPGSSFNYSSDSMKGYGLVCPGGSISIISAMFIAKQSRQSTEDEQLVVYLSKNTHYSFKKGCILLGLGLNNCVIVNVDSDGKMNTEDLKDKILKTLRIGKTPFFVAANACTTTLGCFDDIERISSICQDFGLWLHVDGTFGGSMIFSERYKQMYLKGVENSDSFNFNSHKWLAQPQECSILVLKNPGTVQQVFGEFGHKDDLGMHSGLQWGRRQNIFKFWLTWIIRGKDTWGQHIEYTMCLKDFLVNDLQLNPARQGKFRIWKSDFESPGVLFHYIPKSLRNSDPDFNDVAVQEKLGTVTTLLHARLLKEGIMVIGAFRDNGSSQLLRLVVINSGITEEDIAYMLDQVDKWGNDIVV